MAFETKRDARKYCKDLRDSFGAEEKCLTDSLLCDAVKKLSVFSECDTLLLYYPTQNEPDLLALAKAAWSMGKKVAFPISNLSDYTLTFRTVGSLNALSEGAYGIKEPRSDAPYAVCTERTLCLVPALAADREGYRLGYGKGFYDRFLAGFSGTSVCAISSMLIFESLPINDTDMKIDSVITERGVVKPL